MIAISKLQLALMYNLNAPHLDIYTLAISHPQEPCTRPLRDKRVPQLYDIVINDIVFHEFLVRCSLN